MRRFRDADTPQLLSRDPWRRIAQLSVATLGLMMLMATNASAVNLNLGDPTFPVVGGVQQSFTETFSLCSTANDPASCHDVKLTVSPGDDKVKKATNLVKLIQGDPVLDAAHIHAITNGLLGHEGEVDLRGVAQVAGGFKNESVKEIALGFIVPSGGGVLAGGTTGEIDFEGTLTGLAADGSGPSSFSASLGFGSIVTSAALTSADLSSLTLDVLLSDLFTDLDAGLPAVYQPDLSLDLSKDSISFAFPAGAADPFVAGFSNDAGLTQSLSLAGVPVPEPSSLSLFGFGLASLWMLRRRMAKHPAELSITHI